MVSIKTVLKYSGIREGDVNTKTQGVIRKGCGNPQVEGHEVPTVKMEFQRL